ncbi:MAG: hypothetical protein OXR05_04515 [Gemmatimonadota bacterium]|nr:hypothetical protein [Gemmatimonadota bacterium]
MGSSPKWHFPPRSGGIDYVQNPSSAHFRDNPIPKLVREIVQNSVDARDRDLAGPVVVRFQSTDVPGTLIDAAQLALHMKACLDRAKTDGHPMVEETYRNAMTVLNQDRIPCLRVTDSGTTGLSGSKWNALVVQEGAVQKHDRGAPGGSYGIGKNAVFNVSRLHTVFYSTRFVNGRDGRVEKMQGKATLMSHPDPSNTGSSLQHIGFYRGDDGSPILTTDIPEFFRLPEPGTGVFIIGFDPRSPNWLGEMTAAVIENYFLAIHRKELIVEIDSGATDPTSITHETIDQLFSEYADGADAYAYYRAIRDTEVTVAKRLPRIGELGVHVSIGLGPRRVAYVNRNGMLVTDSREQTVNPLAPRGKSLWPDYGVVVTPTSDYGDAWIRTMENPSHDAISLQQLFDEPARQKAGKILRDARRVIKEIIDRKAAIDRYGDISNLDELAILFPDELDPDRRGNRELPVVDLTLPQERRGHQPEPPGPEPDPPSPDPDPEPDPDPPDPDPIPDPPDPDPSPNPDPDPPPVPPTPNPGSSKRHPMGSVRFIPTGDREAVVAFTPTGDPGEEILFSLVPQGGERDKLDRINLLSARIVDGDHKVKVADGRVLIVPQSASRITVAIVAARTVRDLAVRIG